jgi:hypothetical protein
VISGTAAARFKRLGPFDDVRITLGGDGTIGNGANLR